MTYTGCCTCLYSNGNTVLPLPYSSNRRKERSWGIRQRFGTWMMTPKVTCGAEHGITKEEVEEVLENPEGIESSRSSGRPIAFGETSTRRIIAVVYEEIDQDTVYPVTAYEVEP